MNTKASTETKASPVATHVAVTLRCADRPGIRACGNYAPDRVYQVPIAEAHRLVTGKGFSFVTQGDKFACEEAMKASAAAATTNTSEG